ncbi:MAG TPA: 4-hydroxythreonine-4-phosphate dehydrogenase PdxA [Bryobacteraceae bacterium]|nr:4-hydroxythreonine-4-phosphate dehydrogenase PdxA [Bryobacteraceae bacterium]
MKIVITMGDPAGVGPEIIVKALPAVEGLAEWIIAGHSPTLRTAGLPGVVPVLETGGECVEPGVLSAAAGRSALEAVRAATLLCLAGETAAMVTAPVSKEAITLSGEPFTGHTEFIAGLCGARESRMLLASERLRVIHVTTHMPLRRACELDTERIRRTIELGNEACMRLGFERPRIAVCGLNPHAGEHGLFGDEDERSIAPAVRAAREAGIDAEGPLPADTVFLKAVRGVYDLVVAMYHDQGHIPAKLLGFEQTVNVSLGLPVIRTSVDHGTAFDIAGKGVADAGSMVEAIRLAVRMAKGGITAETQRRRGNFKD